MVPMAWVKLSKNDYLIALSSFVGIIGGLVLASISICFIPVIWSSLVGFNGYLGILESIQVILVLILGSFILSVICIRYFDSHIITEEDAALSGKIIGLIVGCVTFLLILIVPQSTTWYIPYTVGGPVLEYILVIACISIIETKMARRSFQIQRDKDASGKKRAGKFSKYVFIVSIFSVFLITLLLPYFSYIGIWSGIVDEAYKPFCQCSLPAGRISIERINNTDISIIQSCNLAPVYLDTPEYPFKIFINGKEVSNRSVIQSQGLADNINPPDGLINHQGSFVNLSGVDFTGNNTQEEQMVIVEEFYHKQTKICYNGTIPLGISPISVYVFPGRQQYI